ncbi:T9SS type A sorting domain-containing protein [Fulvivirga lutea]|uniref:T9SS type A sorting domain-containing protein n=1 Tax=Fulvivirga lutea TaxID=2810512 RepID=A0A975A1L9_9BACT|nr:T9SS type A sorting domain-containing protein [Fulvivirga lutea]QSE98466.1 T9SS type A sorting domain-containing protein [Fulvivirga lutea]
MVRLLTATMLLYGIAANAQSIKSYSFAPAGGTFSTSSVTGLWQIGGITRGSVANQNFTIQQEYVKGSQYIEVTSFDNAGVNTVNVYPNPTANHINISLNDKFIDAPIEYNLYNSQGALIKSDPLGNGYTHQTLDLSDMNQGVYLLILTDRRTSQSLKFRIIKN